MKIIEHHPRLDVRKLPKIRGNTLNFTIGDKHYSIKIAYKHRGKGAWRQFLLCPKCQREFDLLSFYDNTFKCPKCHGLSYQSEYRSIALSNVIKGRKRILEYLPRTNSMNLPNVVAHS